MRFLIIRKWLTFSGHRVCVSRRHEHICVGRVRVWRQESVVVRAGSQVGLLRRKVRRHVLRHVREAERRPGGLRVRRQGVVVRHRHHGSGMAVLRPARKLLRDVQTIRNVHRRSIDSSKSMSMCRFV